MCFESLRAFLSHNLLSNGVFIRLSDPPDLWRRKGIPRTELIYQLVEGWKTIFTRPNTPKFVFSIWYGKTGSGPSIRESVRTVYDAAYEGNRFQPRANFPQWATIDIWLNDMENLIKLFNRPPDDLANLPPDLVKNFWTSGLELYDFIQGIQKGGDRFWNYFEPKT